MDIKVVLPMLVSNGIGKSLEPYTDNPSSPPPPESLVYVGLIAVVVFEPLLHNLDASAPSTMPPVMTRIIVKKKSIIKGLNERHPRK